MTLRGTPICYVQQVAGELHIEEKRAKSAVNDMVEETVVEWVVPGRSFRLAPPWVVGHYGQRNVAIVRTLWSLADEILSRIWKQQIPWELREAGIWMVQRAFPVNIYLVRHHSILDILTAFL
jgi:hypothetical protein